jgi:uncharacterized repeat protein (TIGR01451 family)
VENTSPSETVTLTGLSDDVFGDLLDAGNAAVSANSCAGQGGVSIPTGGTFTCSFDGLVSGGFGDPDHVNVVSATVEDDDGNPASDGDVATVGFASDPPSLTVAKTADPGSVAEAGETVTFTVEVTNDGAEPVTLTALSDDVFGDLLDAGNAAVSANSCAGADAVIPAGASLSCIFEGFVGGDPGADHVNVVTATVEDDDGETASGSDSETVTVLDADPTISITKTPSVSSLPEPGGKVTFTVTITAGADEDVTLTALSDDVFGDLLDGGNPAVFDNYCASVGGSVIPAGETLTCEFSAELSGGAADPDHVDVVTVVAEDDEGNVVSDGDDAVVGFSDVVPSVAVTKSASASSVAVPGEVVTFTVTVSNTSASEPVTVTALSDDVFGDLLDAGNGLVSANSCSTVGPVIAAGESVSCSFRALVEGDAGDPAHVNVVTATVVDDDGNSVADGDDAVVGFVETTGVLTGHVFADYDGDGVQDPGEPPLPGVEVAVTDSAGTTVVVTTDGNGDWSLVVPVGETSIDVDESTVPAGWVLTTDNEMQTVWVDPSGATEDVGYRPPPAAISGTLWLDLDGDYSTQSLGEPPLPGVRVVLLDGSGVVVAETVTDADGFYEFGGLAPGTYTVEVDGSAVPAGTVIVADPDSVVDAETTVPLDAGERVDDRDFVYEGTGVIGDTVWVDEDGDGVPDDAEPRIPGAEVTLVWAGLDGVFGTADDYLFPVAVTGGDGQYRFSGLPPGAYRVSVRLSSIDPALAPVTGTSVDVTLAPGEIYLAGDFGFSTGSYALPYTGLDSARLTMIALLLTATGLTLLWVADREERRRARGDGSDRPPV